jgi:lipopolysaccharide/colanic/teichoic acid biosynthesis glycosyltransferase
MIRFFDILFSSLAIIVLFLFMLPIMIILKLTGEHYIFYKQQRIGRYGKEFGVLKFATMLKDSPNLPGGTFTLKDDPRILPLGKFLRKTKINELPQLINILIGQMSIIGYRPLVRQGYDAYSEETKRKLYTIKPGLSGIGSIAVRNEEEILQNTEDKERFYNEIIIPYKAALESWFIAHIGISMYFKLIFFTVLVVIKPQSNRWKHAFKDLPDEPLDFAYYQEKSKQ